MPPKSTASSGRGTLKRTRTRATASSPTNAAVENAEDEENDTPTTPSKRRRVAPAKDVYDDIEGAHEAPPAVKGKKGRATKATKDKDAEESKAVVEEKPKRKRGRPRKVDKEREAQEVAAAAAAASAKTNPRKNSKKGDDDATNTEKGRVLRNGKPSPANVSEEADNQIQDATKVGLETADVPSPMKKRTAAEILLNQRRVDIVKRGRKLKVAPAYEPTPDRTDSEADQGLLDMQLQIDPPRPPGEEKAAKAPDLEQIPMLEPTTPSPKKKRKRPKTDEESVDGRLTVTKKLSAAQEITSDRPAIEITTPVEPLNAQESEHLEIIQTVVLSKITNRRPVPLTNLSEEYAKVYSVVQNTIVAGEGNSMLLIGARGSGKSALTEAVLTELRKEHGEEFHIVRLSGFFQTDDKIALREIWRQLGREMEIEDESAGKSYADTLATLLALLSHPSESGTEDTDKVAKAIIFIMDEFDLFATHPRQTLLYNLFDIAQSRKAPIVVLGLTTRIDVVESLEKRVKSRFSHRYVHISLPRNFGQYQEVCKAVLSVKEDELDNEEAEKLLQSSTAKSGKGNEASTDTFLTRWNAYVKALFDNQQFLETHLQPLYYLNKSIPSAMTSFHIPVASLTPYSPLLVPSASTPSCSLQPPDSKLAHLSTLPTLALSILIASARLDIIHNTSLLNFNMAYAEYSSLAAKARIASAAAGQLAVGASSGAKVYGRDVARREWERLLGLELLVPVVGGMGWSGLAGGGAAASAASGGGGWATQMVRCDVALEEIAPSVPTISKMLERWCKQI